MEHVFNQFTAFLRSWHCSGANETPVAGDTRGSDSSQLKDKNSRLLKSVGFAKMSIRRLNLREDI